MKIISSSIQFLTEYRQRTSAENQSSLTYNRDSTANINATTSRTLSSENYQLEQRARLSSALQQSTYSTSQIRQQGDTAIKNLTTQKTVNTMLERFYAYSVRVNQLQIKDANAASIATHSTASSSQLITDSYYEISREQQLSFVAQGQINTEDGRNIQFQFYASAQQSFRYQEASGSYAEKVVRRTDPLVINLEGDINNLSSASFSFDLNNDGNREDISFAGSGSGFLVLDKNNDGVVNNGSELFGTQTGDGFMELAAYDEDGNGFIDAGDSVYEQLQLWSKDAEGNDRLTRLQDAGIAALGTASGAAPFAITDHYDNEFGQAQRTGIFVRESGAVGTIQQVDLTQRDSTAEAQLTQRFAVGEQRAALQAATAEAQTPQPLLPADLDAAIERLEQETQAMLARQDELAKLDEKDGPPSLLAQLVEKLEEVRQQQEEQREDTRDSD